MKIGILFFGWSFAIFSLNIASGEENFRTAENIQNRKGIYFCTRDLEEDRSSYYSSVESDKSKERSAGDVLVVNGDGEPNYRRHCFVLLAREIASVRHAGKLTLEISHGFSHGYYPLASGKSRWYVSSEDFWLFNKKARNMYAVSCTPLIQEGDKGKKKHSMGVRINEDDLYSVWNILVKAMLKENDKNFLQDEPQSDCCSAVWECLKKVGENNHLFSLSNINKQRFNLAGCGIAWGYGDDGFLDYDDGAGGFSQEWPKGVLRVIVNRISNLHSEKAQKEQQAQHEEL